MKIAEEKFSDAVAEMEPLLERHWRELARFRDCIPLAPDYARYAAAEAAGQLVVFTVRADDGKVAGYAWYFVGRHLHYATTLWAHLDIFWVAPEHRGRGNGLISPGAALVDFAERALADRGVAVIYMATKIGHPELARILEARGYAPMDLVMGKMVNRPEVILGATERA